MNKQEQQNLYKELITSIIVDDRTLSTQGADFEFKTADKLILRVGKRQEFKSSFETVLKKQKVPFESKLISGSSFQSTVIDFTKYFRELKSLTVMYKEGGGANSDKPAKVKTAWQERGAAYIFEQALVKNVDYDKKIKAAMVKLKTNSVVLTKKVLPEDVLLETFKDDLSGIKMWDISKDYMSAGLGGSYKPTNNKNIKEYENHNNINSSYSNSNASSSSGGFVIHSSSNTGRMQFIAGLHSKSLGRKPS
jgi:hypothetical protein